MRREGEGERVGLLITLVFWVGVLMFIYRIYSALVLLKAFFAGFCGSGVIFVCFRGCAGDFAGLFFGGSENFFLTDSADI